MAGYWGWNKIVFVYHLIITAVYVFMKQLKSQQILQYILILWLNSASSVAVLKISGWGVCSEHAIVTNFW